MPSVTPRGRASVSPGNPVIVIYHDVTDTPDPLTAQLGMTTRPDVFRRHIAYFARNFDLIAAADLLDGRLPRRPLLITFDDAYRSVLDIAGPLLREAAAPSLFFLIAAAVRGDTVPVDNALSLAAETLGLPRVRTLAGLDDTSAAAVGDIVSGPVAALSRAEIATLKQRVFDALGTTEATVRRQSTIFLDPADLARFADCRIAVGNHSMTHSHFRSLSPPELEVEVGQSRAELQRWSGQPVDCLSIPFGDRRDATVSALGAARASGHRAVFLVGARSNRSRRGDAPYYRVSLRNEPSARLPVTLRVLPVLRSLRDAVAGRA